MSKKELKDKGNILVVDDTPENLEVLNRLLESEGHTVRMVTSGELALKSAAASLPDLILLDVNMPEMTGYEVCQQIRVNPQLQEIPVVFISALNEVDDKLVGYAVGGNDYITKPFDCEEVMVRVKVQLKIRLLKRNLAAVCKEKNRMNHILEQLRNSLGEDALASINLLTKLANGLLNKEYGPVTDKQEECLWEIVKIGKKHLRKLKDAIEMTDEHGFDLFLEQKAPPQ